MTNNNSKQTKAPSLTKASEIVNKGTHAVTDSANSVTKISEVLNDEDALFLAENLPQAEELRQRLLEQILEKDTISPEDLKKLQILDEAAKAQTTERVRLTDSRAALNRSQGSKVLRICGGLLAGGLGIDLGARGISFLMNTWRNNHNNNKPT